MRVTKLSAIVIAMGATIGSGCAWAQGVAPAASAPPPVITATGRGEAHVAADHATVTIAVETHAPTASAAAAANATAMTATLAALHRIGVTDADLSTTGFSVSTDYMRPTPTNAPAPISFVARNGVRVDLRTPTKLGTVIDSTLAAGATQVGQAQFTSSRVDELRRAALTQAVEQAHADAEAIARGGRLARRAHRDLRAWERPHFLRIPVAVIGADPRRRRWRRSAASTHTARAERRHDRGRRDGTVALHPPTLRLIA